MSKNLCYLDLNTASKHYFFTRFLTNYCFYTFMTISLDVSAFFSNFAA